MNTSVSNLSAVVCCAIGVVFAAGASTNSHAAQPAVPRWRGSIDLTLGGDATSSGADFARVTGIAVDPAGRIFVADGEDQQIRVFSATGTALPSIGRKGSGPMEFKRLAAIAFGPDGKLWTRDEGNARLALLDVAKAPPTLSRVIPMKQFTGGSRWPITFEREGQVIDESIWFDKTVDAFRPLRLRISNTGDVLRVDTLVVPPGAFAGEHNATKVQKDAAGTVIGMSSRRYAQPHGPKWLRAYGPNGMRADAVGSSYAVRIYDGNGRLVRTIAREVPPVPLSARERKLADSTIDAIKVDVPFGVPSAKAPIIGILWTQAGELWVERAMPDGAVREADVYDAKGQRIAVAEWPRAINLMDPLSVVRGPTAYAPTWNADDLPQVVRLRFR